MTRPQRICHVTTVHSWSDIRIFMKMCVGLAARGHAVTLVAPVPSERTEHGVRIVPTGLEGKLARTLGGPVLLHRLRNIAADIFHFHDPELLPWMAWFGRATRRKVVYDVHEYYPESVIDSNYFGLRPLSYVAGEMFGLIEPALGRRLAGVVGVTEPIAQRFAGGRARVAVVHNYVSLGGLAGGNGRTRGSVSLPSARTLVLAGALDDNRLMPELVDALAILAPRWKDLSLLCLGEVSDPNDPHGRELRRRAASRQVADRVHFASRVPWQELQRYLAASVAGLVLYTDRQNNRWALPNRLFEFMAQGVPIVASDFPLLRQVVTGSRCGVLLGSGTPGSIAGGIEQILRDPAVASAMGARGSEAVRREYNWEAELDRLEEFYAAL